MRWWSPSRQPTFQSLQACTILALTVEMSSPRCRRTCSSTLHLLTTHPRRAFWSCISGQSSLLRQAAAVTLQAQPQSHCYSSITRTSSPLANAMNTVGQRSHPTELQGQSGRQYKIEHVLQDKGPLLGRVFLATYVVSGRTNTVTDRLWYREGNDKFVLKEIPRNNYEFRL